MNESIRKPKKIQTQRTQFSVYSLLLGVRLYTTAVCWGEMDLLSQARWWAPWRKIQEAGLKRNTRGQLDDKEFLFIGKSKEGFMLFSLHTETQLSIGAQHTCCHQLGPSKVLLSAHFCLLKANGCVGRACRPIFRPSLHLLRGKRQYFLLLLINDESAIDPSDWRSRPEQILGGQQVTKEHATVWVAEARG